MEKERARGEEYLRRKELSKRRINLENHLKSNNYEIKMRLNYEIKISLNCAIRIRLKI